MPILRSCYYVNYYNVMKFQEWSETEFRGATIFAIKICCRKGRNGNMHGGR